MVDLTLLFSITLIIVINELDITHFENIIVLKIKVLLIVTLN